MNKTKISAHISYDEATVSPTALRLGIKNEPNEAELSAMRLVAELCFEKARSVFGPIKINSFFRSKELNKAIGGSNTSHHCLGCAIDMTLGSRSKNKELFTWCKDNLEFTQLIHEYGDNTGPDWVHISYVPSDLKKQVLYIK